MKRPSFSRAILAASLALGLAAASPSAAATGSWSPRCSGPPAQLWMHPGAVRILRVGAEIAPITPERHHRDAPLATGARIVWSASFFIDQQPPRRSHSSERVQVTRSAATPLETTSLSYPRARAADLAALAGIFHEAHAPPLPLLSV